MNKWVSFILAGLISLSVAGCNLVAKEETKQPPKQEQAHQKKPQDPNTAKADSVLADAKPLQVGSMTVYVDDQKWTSRRVTDEGYEVIPVTPDNVTLQRIFVKIEEQPFPKLDRENGAKRVVDEYFSPDAPPDSFQYETLKFEANDILLRYQMDFDGRFEEGFMRFFGNDQKTGLVVYMNMDGANKEKMEKWQKRIEASRFAGSQ